MGISQDEMSGLRNAVDYSRRDLRVHRVNRREMIRTVCGHHYGDNGAIDRTPLNPVALYLAIIVRHLSARLPRATVDTEYRQLKPDARNLELALNYLGRQIDLAETMRLAVVDAMYGMGIVIMGLDAQQVGQVDDLRFNIGAPFCDRIDFDDWVHDVYAKHWMQRRFAGYRTRPSYAKVMSNPFYTEEGKKQVTRYDQYLAREDGEERVEELSRSNQGFGGDEFAPGCELLHVEVPHRSIMVTFPAAVGADIPLYVRPLTCPKKGPFRVLSFGAVPNNIMPSSPMSQLQDLSEAIEHVANKVIRQAERQKSIMLARLRGMQDARAILNSGDGDTIPIEDPSSAQEVSVGGADQRSVALLGMLQEMFSYRAGNLETLGGLSPQADTARQEDLLANAAGKQIEEMGDRTHEFMAGIYEDLGFHLFNHPLIELPIVKCAPGFPDITLHQTWSSAYRAGEFYQYNFAIDVYSAQYMTPAKRLQGLQTLVSNFFLPLLPLMQSQGQILDTALLVELVAKYSGFTDLKDLIIPLGKPLDSRDPIGERPMKAQNTTRTNVRINRSAPNQASKMQALRQQMMAGANSNGLSQQSRATG